MARLVLALSLAVFVGVGCGPKAPPPPPPAPAPATLAKNVLQDVANSGVTGSDVLELQSYFEEIKKTDAAKGDALLKDLDTLIRTGAAQAG